MKAERTKYFSHTINPVRRGLYEVVTEDCKWWGCKEPHLIRFYGRKWDWARYEPMPTKFKWRGLTHQPNEQEQR